jgi:hypothetical protein
MKSIVTMQNKQFLGCNKNRKLYNTNGKQNTNRKLYKYNAHGN